jgi:hypothetical protein
LKVKTNITTGFSVVNYPSQDLFSGGSGLIARNLGSQENPYNS